MFGTVSSSVFNAFIRLCFRMYNQSCEEDLSMQRGPTLCCTLDDVPLIRILPAEYRDRPCRGVQGPVEGQALQWSAQDRPVQGQALPWSAWVLLWSAQAMLWMMVIVLLRYAHVIEKHQNCVLNTASLSTGWICSAGLIMVGNFQVDNAKVLHYVGAGVAFPTSMLFVCLQCALTYRLAKTQGEYSVGHLRLIMTLLAFVALVLSGVFFVQESFVLQHASAIFEWVFCVIIMLFYGTFAFEFAGISSDTMMVLARGGVLGSTSRDHKMESLSGANSHQSEGTAML
ncbi:hypothetical protein P4O66_013579 [Electrophorus voltai]|uniref:CWH43-like N-terminal domain-containing protein n=1 Tax=Electrophorus voltai TaxID=2609070 RepID=A0AAD8Z352_9TELE|nr:hypothetical protein P4O66_013579 [Electrophorus voltai]